MTARSGQTTFAVPLDEEALFRAIDCRPPAVESHRRRLEALRGNVSQWDAVDFPVEISVEITSDCNLACVMCPVPSTRRPHVHMAETTYLAALRGLAAEAGFIFFPQGFGEPLLQPSWARFLSLARSQVDGPIVLMTNATLLDAVARRELLASGVDVVIAGVDAVDSDTYELLRPGGRLREVEANVRDLIQERGQGRQPLVVVQLTRMRANQADGPAFRERWQEFLGPGDFVRIKTFTDWAGNASRRVGPTDALAPLPADVPCRMLWRNLSVHADGKVSACFCDSEDELIVGDLAGGQTLAQIWRARPLQDLRDAHRRGIDAQPRICRECRVRC